MFFFLFGAHDVKRRWPNEHMCPAGASTPMAIWKLMAKKTERRNKKQKNNKLRTKYNNNDIRIYI